MNLNNSGCTDSRRLKGFTLIEVLIVIAIIAILAGITSMALSGFRRDAKIETNNDRAQMVFTAFQDVVIDCEIKQDKSIFDVHSEASNSWGEIRGAVLFFRISEKAYDGTANKNGGSGLGDEIHIMTTYENDTGYSPDPSNAPKVASGSVWIDKNATGNVSGYSGYNNYSTDPFSGDPDGGAYLWNKWNTAVAGRIDPSMEGTYAVMIDLENYEVRSVICRDLVNGKDPKTGLYVPWECASGMDLQQFAEGADYVTPVGGDEMELPCRMYFIKDISKEREAVSKKGIYMGCYPFRTDMYDSVREK